MSDIPLWKKWWIKLVAPKVLGRDDGYFATVYRYKGAWYMFDEPKKEDNNE